MISPMRKIAVYGVQSSRKAVLEELQKCGWVEIKKTEHDNTGLDSPDAAAAISRFDKYIASSQRALEILDEYEPEKTGMFKLRKDISIDKYSMTQDEINIVGAKTTEILQCQKNIDENILSVAREEALILSYEPWKRLDIPMNFKNTESQSIMLVSAPFELNIDTMDNILGETLEFTYYEIVSAAGDMSCVFIVCPREKEDEINRILREKGFSLPAASLSHKTPADKIRSIKEKIESIKQQNIELEDKIKSYAECRNEIKLFYDHLVMRKEKYINLENILVTEEAFIIEGFVLQKKESQLAARLEKAGLCAVEFYDVAEDEEAPVFMENNAFVSPVESITADYALPAKNDIDPNAVMSIFYYAFFGMMFSDAGYGILMALVAGYIGFIAKVERSTKQFMRMFCYCGISTTFWGFMFGSFFGDVVPSLKPLWVNPIDEPLLILIFSVGLGLIQIITGLVLKFYVDYRAGDKSGAIYDTGSWIFILVGAGVAAASVVIKNDTVMKIGIALAALGVITVLLMHGRGKNIFSRIISGVVGLYDVTSYVSDLLSYSRLMALGLATGVIGNVVNLMSGLGGDGIIGSIAYVLIFTFGHALNFAINVLGAYVHTNRLQYVEFYSKFYEGGGKKFAPLSMNTKYYNFSEDDEK